MLIVSGEGEILTICFGWYSRFQAEKRFESVLTVTKKGLTRSNRARGRGLTGWELGVHLEYFYRHSPACEIARFSCTIGFDRLRGEQTAFTGRHPVSSSSFAHSQSRDTWSLSLLKEGRIQIKSGWFDSRSNHVWFDLRSNHVWFDSGQIKLIWFEIKSRWFDTSRSLGRETELPWRLDSWLTDLLRIKLIRNDVASGIAGCLVYSKSNWLKMTAQATRYWRDLLQINEIWNDFESGVTGCLIYNKSEWLEMIVQATWRQLNLIWDQIRFDLISGWHVAYRTYIRTRWSEMVQKA